MSSLRPSSRSSKILEFIQESSIEPFKNIQMDSRSIHPGDLFIAVPGVLQDGRQFIENAIKKGAVAVLAEQDASLPHTYIHHGITIHAIPHLKQKVGYIVHKWFSPEIHAITPIGITGTNGKTSCSLFLAQILKKLHQPAGVIGTLGCGLYPECTPTHNTTPNLMMLHQTLAHWAQKCIPWAIIEATSHALCQGRTDGICFNSALFTNLSHDHLDYHKDMAHYARAKAKLFSCTTLDYAIINYDDPYADIMIRATSSKTQCITYSLKQPKADLYWQPHKTQPTTVSGLLSTPWGHGTLTTSLIGEFTIYNLLGVIGLLGCYAFNIHDILQIIPTLCNAPGRMNLHQGTAEAPHVIVDYAHTPEALAKTLEAVQKHYLSKNIVCVFGCGGNRDQKKRAPMFHAAQRYAQSIVLTNDNPRFEHPHDIIHDMTQYATTQEMQRVRIILDRSQAIHYAITTASSKDIVVIAGKGHETHQEICGIYYPCDDQQSVRNTLAH